MIKGPISLLMARDARACLRAALLSLVVVCVPAGCAKFVDRLTYVQGTTLDQHGHVIASPVVSFQTLDSLQCGDVVTRVDGSFEVFAYDEPESRFFGDEKACDLVVSAPGHRPHTQRIRMGSRVKNLTVTLVADESLPPPNNAPRQP